jgi:hypothetical protein
MKKKISATAPLLMAIGLGFFTASGCVLDKPVAGEEPDPVDVLYVHEQLGDDANPGTADSPFFSIQAAIDQAVGLDPKPEVHVASGTYGADYRDTGAPAVLLKDGVRLYGGYSAGDWEQRDSELYPTVIEDLSDSGGSLSDPNRALAAEAGTGNGSVVDGFVILGGDGDISFAVFLRDASPQLKNCTIDGGEGTSFSVGIYNLDAASPTIESNTILGGDGDISFGIYNYTNCSPLIESNRIDGAGSGSQSLAIYNDLFCPAVIRNNLIDGGGGAYSLGIMNFESSPIVRNNTISAGRNSADWSVALFNQTARPVIQNNIVFSIDGLGRIGLYEFDAASDPAALQNNDIFDCPTALYADADGNGFLLTAADLNDYSRTTQDIVSPSENNISDDALLVDIDGADDDPTTPQDNDWALSSASPAEVVLGGLNGAHSSAGWGYTTDFSGALRSPLDDTGIEGWSMGAHEYDATAAKSLSADSPATAPPAPAEAISPVSGAPPQPLPLRSR